MAIDFYFASICHPYSTPILRFYGWSPKCISIGCHQRSDIINLSKLKQEGCDFVMRPTGGRAILHEAELTYSIITPKESIHHKDLYLFIHIVLSNALNRLGYPVEIKKDNEKLESLSHKPDDFPCFTKFAQTEVQYKNKKLIGSAQKLYSNAILQHGSILIGKAHEKLTLYLNIEASERKKIQKELSEKTTCLNNIKKSDISPELIMKTIINQLESMNNISLNFVDLNENELNTSEKYVQNFI